MKKLLLLLLALPSVTFAIERDVNGHIVRSRTVAARFQRHHPCPSTGLRYGACPGYIRDHKIALACGGRDSARNLQWQTIADAKAKDRWELKACNKP